MRKEFKETYLQFRKKYEDTNDKYKKALEEFDSLKKKLDSKLETTYTLLDIYESSESVQLRAKCFETILEAKSVCDECHEKFLEVGRQVLELNNRVSLGIIIESAYDLFDAIDWFNETTILSPKDWSAHVDTGELQNIICNLIAGEEDTKKLESELRKTYAIFALKQGRLKSRVEAGFEDSSKAMGEDMEYHLYVSNIVRDIRNLLEMLD